MATAPGSTEPLAVASWEAAEPAVERSKSDRYLARRLAAASADVKGVAVATFLLAAGLVVTAWVVTGVVVEHWLVPGGLSPATRWAWLATGLVGLALAAARWLLPLVRYRVNLLYAARAIEQDHPELRNDLVNAVLVKSRPEGAAPIVVRSLERRAAKRLSNVAADGVIDRGPALRLAVALAGLVAAACLYELFAPKSLLVSAARLLAPWSSLAAPARVAIEPPRLAWRLPAAAAGPGAERQDHELVAVDGAAKLVRGRQLVVSCDVRGLRPGEPVRLSVTPIRDDGTVDPAAVPWEAPLVAAGSAGRHLAVLPDATRGLQHSVDLLVTAGDAPGHRLRVNVVDIPSLLVREVRYDYPDYTRREPETVAWQGDVRAVEGTRVTVVAEGNRPLKSAWIDKNCDGSKDVQLRVGQRDPHRATGSFTLRLDADRAAAAPGSYRLEFEPRAAAPTGREETVVERMEHRIEVLPDLVPEVSVEEPREQVVVVPPDAPVAIRVRALDPDFGLARVGLETRLSGGPTQPETVIFRGNRPGSFVGNAEIVPARLGAGPGSVIEYRAVAADAKPDPANVAHSPWQVLRVEAGAPPREPPARSDEPRDGPREQSPAAGGQSRDDSEPQTGDDPKDDSNKENAGGQQEPPASEGRQTGGQEAADDQAAGQQSGGQQDAGAQAGGDQSGAGQGSERQPAGQQGSGQPGAEQQGSGEQGDARQGSERQRTDQPGSEQRGGRPQAGEQQGGEQQGGEQQGGGEGAGERSPRDSVAADGTNDGEAVERILEQRRQESATEGEGKPQDGSQQQSECNPAEGKPCSQEGCSTCRGGGKPGSGGAGSGSAGGQPGGAPESAAGQAAGEQSGGQGDRQPAGDQAGGQNGGQTPSSKDGTQGNGQGEASPAGGDAAAQSGEPDARGPGSQAAGAGEAQGTGQARDERQTEPQSRAQGRETGKDEGAGQGEAAGQGEGAAPAAGGKPAAGPPEAKAGSAASGDDSDAGRRQDAAPQQADGGDPAGGAAQGQATTPATQASHAESSAPGGSVGAGGRAGGDAGQAGAGDDAAAPPGEMEWTDQDHAHARNAADTAIEHLRESLAAGRRDVLDALGWTPEQARAFLDRWQALRRMAGSSDPRERGAYERTLRSLGLRPDGVRSSRDVPADAPGGQAEGRRSRPPASYREQFRAYLQGTAGE